MSAGTKQNTFTGARYTCPLDGTALIPTEDGWLCTHQNGKSGSHETKLAYDNKDEEVVEQLAKGIQAVKIE